MFMLWKVKLQNKSLDEVNITMGFNSKKNPHVHKLQSYYPQKPPKIVVPE